MMMKRTWLLGAVAALAIGCGNSSSQVRHEGSISTVTFPVAFGNYSRVYNTTYEIVNRYAVIKHASYKQGVIEAELSQDTSLFEKTRRTVLARLYDTGEYWDVECRVLIEREESDVETLRKYQPRYKWQVVSYDQFLETRLNNEIKSALTGGAWKAKAPLTVQKSPSDSPAVRFKVDSKSETAVNKAVEEALKEQEVGPPPANQVISAEAAPQGLNAQQYNRLGVQYFERGDFQKAQLSFQSALTVDRGNATAAYLTTQSRFALGEYTAAARSLRAAFQLEPEWDASKLNVKSLYSDTAILAKQQTALAEHIAQNKGDLDARILLGWSHYATGNYKAARDHLGFVSLSRPDDSLAQQLLRKANVKIALSSGKLREF